MTLRRLLMVAAWTFAFPGAGQGAAGRRVAMLAWAAAGAAALVAVTWSVWGLPLALAVRLASMGDAIVRLRARARRDAAADNKDLPLYASLVGVAGFVWLQVFTDHFRIPASSMVPTIAVEDRLFVDTLTIRWRPPARGEVIVFEHPCQPRISYVKRVIAVGGDTVEVRCDRLYVNGAAVPATRVEGPCTYADRGDDGWITRTCSRYRETLGGHTYDTFHAEDRPARERAGDVAHDAFALRGDFPSLDRPLAGCGGFGGGVDTPPSDQPRGDVVDTQPGAAACAPQRHYVVPAGTLFTMGDNRGNSADSRHWGVVPRARVIGRALGVVLPVGRFGPIE